MKAPAYQVYASDELSSLLFTTGSAAAIGVFQLLRNRCWIDGFIPSEIPQLAKICRISGKQMEKIWKELGNVFIPGDEGTLSLPPLELQRAERDKFLSDQQKAGKKGAEKRWGRHSDPNGVAIESLLGSPSKKNGSPSPSPSPSPIPLPIHNSNTGAPPVPIKHDAGGGKRKLSDRANGNGAKPQDGQKAAELVRAWIPVAMYLRSQVTAEAYEELYAGARILETDTERVLLAVPEALITRYGDKTAEHITEAARQASVDLNRDRRLEVVSIESVVEGALK